MMTLLDDIIGDIDEIDIGEDDDVQPEIVEAGNIKMDEDTLG